MTMRLSCTSRDGSVRRVTDPARAFLLDLLRAHGPSGNEAAASAVWRAYAGGFARVHGDPMGSSYAHVGPAEGPPVLLLGHIDEIGLIVTAIETEEAWEGTARVRPLGHWDAQVLVGQAMEVQTARGELLPAVIGKLPIHLLDEEARRHPSTMESLWLDVGARDAADARSLIAVGDTVVPAPAPRELANRRLASKALDNRTGAWVVAEAARRVAAAGNVRVPVVAAAPVLEETTMDGGRGVAHTVAPAVTIVVDVTHAGDVPDAELGSTGVVRLGGGPILTRGLGMHPGLHARLEACAAEHGIRFGSEAAGGESSTYTDVDGALDAHAGSATALVSIPLRHMHSPAEVCSLDDVDAAAELIARLCLALAPDVDWDR
jgi:endoglucanase